MRPEERDPACLWDIIEAARAIVDFTRDLTPEEFLAPGRSGEINTARSGAGVGDSGGGGAQSQLALS